MFPFWNFFSPRILSSLFFLNSKLVLSFNDSCSQAIIRAKQRNAKQKRKVLYSIKSAFFFCLFSVSYFITFSTIFIGSKLFSFPSMQNLTNSTLSKYAGFWLFRCLWSNQCPRFHLRDSLPLILYFVYSIRSFLNFRFD